MLAQKNPCMVFAVSRTITLVNRYKLHTHHPEKGRYERHGSYHLRDMRAFFPPISTENGGGISSIIRFS